MPKTFLDKNNNTLYTGYETYEIVANPTLEGTEADLTGLQVGNTKYKVGGGSSTGASFFSIFDLVDYANGKHVDVDTLVTLLEEKGLYSSDATNPDYFEIGSGYYESDLVNYHNYDVVLGVYNNSSNYLNILGQIYELNDRIETYKDTIESYVYNKEDWFGSAHPDGFPDSLISLITFNETDAKYDKVVFTYDEIKSIFVE